MLENIQKDLEEFKKYSLYIKEKYPKKYPNFIGYSCKLSSFLVIQTFWKSISVVFIFSFMIGYFKCLKEGVIPTQTPFFYIFLLLIFIPLCLYTSVTRKVMIAQQLKEMKLEIEDPSVIKGFIINLIFTPILTPFLFIPCILGLHRAVSQYLIVKFILKD